MKGCRRGPTTDYTLEDVVLEALAGLDVPVALDLSSGHTTSPNVTLPLGVRARSPAMRGADALEVAVAARRRGGGRA